MKREHAIAELGAPRVMRDTGQERHATLARFGSVRARTRALAAPLGVDEQLVQAFPDASPTKWHLGHTTWFFDRFVLGAFARGHEVDPALEFVFNSYYEAVGPRQPRERRGEIVRPTLREVNDYRSRVDEAVARFVAEADETTWARAAFALELGTHHEEQHQELLLTDVKPVLAGSRVRIGYPTAPRPAWTAPALSWASHAGGLVEIGAAPEAGFHFDNEAPRHRVWLEPFEIASRPVTAREMLAFVEDDGYRTASLWLSDGWHAVRAEGWSAPRDWHRIDGVWHERELGGDVPLDLEAPVTHVSFYEADAYARWAGARLPSEAEWEATAIAEPIAGNLLETGALHPRAAPPDATQRFGDVWEWTTSSYAPYPRFRAFAGAFGEYNGKFMCSQMVLRGGSALTPSDHIRASYRNFFPPPARWQMTGLRLARWSER